MKYNQPYDQPGSPDAAYNDGNPAAGVEGSIVPAASVEYPQREIVEVIQYAHDQGYTDQDGLPCANPSNSDLRQLRKALTGFGLAAGIPYTTDQSATPNVITAAFTPAILTLVAGKVILVKIANTVTGATIINVNGIPSKQVHRIDGTNLQLNDIFAGTMCLLGYDGASFQCIGMIGVPALPILLAPKNWYVNTSTGNDSTLDGTAAIITGGHGPFKTIGRSMAEIIKYNMNGYNQSINIADGTYAETVVAPPLNGSGLVNVIGNTTTPDNVSIQGLVSQTAFLVGGGIYILDGLKLTSGGAPTVGDPRFGLQVLAGVVETRRMSFGACGGAHIAVNQSGALSLGPGSIKIAGAADNHVQVFNQGNLLLADEFNSANWPDLNVSTPVTFGTAFVSVGGLASAAFFYKSITSPGNVTGKRYDVQYNAILNARGGTFPGTIAGTTSTGGVYIP